MRVLAVAVRYQSSLVRGQALQGLQRALSADASLRTAFDVFVWDNSPEPDDPASLSMEVLYRHDGLNSGVSGAYNGALAYAVEHGYPWMLLLDQDSTVTAEFLQGMLRHARKVEGKPEIAAIAPAVKVVDFVASPRRQLRFNRSRPYPAGAIGIAPGEAGLCNSGALVRTSALAAIGGFSTDFWLDYSDGYVFHQFFLRGKKIWRAADVFLDHEMTMLDYDRLMAPWRYRNFSYAETAFHDLYRGRLENMAQTIRLVPRSVKQRLRFKNPEFSRITWEQLLYRLRIPRLARIRIWKQRQGRFLAAPANPQTL